MRHGLLAIAAATAVCSGAVLLLNAALAGGLPAEQLTLATAAATLMLSALAVFLCVGAYARASTAAKDIRRLSMSLDRATRAFDQRADEDRAILGDLATELVREI